MSRMISMLVALLMLMGCIIPGAMSDEVTPDAELAAAIAAAEAEAPAAAAAGTALE